MRNKIILRSQVKTAIDVVVYIIENNPQISHVTFTKYPMKAASSPIDSLKNLEETLLQHKENEDYPPIERIDVTREKLFKMCKELSIGKCLAVRSKVKTSSKKILYIPLLDFVCKKGDDNLLFLVNLMSKVHDCDKLEKEGFLLETTHSYHYYGASLLTIEDWIKFIGRCLLLHPRPEDLETAMQLGASAVIDARFLGHSLLAGQGSLRVSADCQGEFPRVVATIESGRQ